MADHALAERPPVEVPPFPAKLTVTRRDCTIIGLAASRGSLDPLQAAVQARWGATLPTTPLLHAAAGLAFIWAGPEKWLLVADGQDDTLMPSCREALGSHAAVVELGDGRCVLRLSGACVRTALASLLPIDLHPSVFGPGSTALTLAGHVNVQIWQLDDTPAYELVVARSFAGSLVHHLATIAAAL